MCSFIVTNIDSHLINLKFINKFSLSRGPDLTNNYFDKESNITWIHNLLHITGEKTQQPFVSEDNISVFNGQIYNYKDFNSTSKSDGYCLNKVIKHELWKDLDGEFAIVSHDKKNNRLLIISDTFATKPCWISLQDNTFAVSSYLSSNLRLGFNRKNTFKTKPNTIYQISLDTFHIKENIIYDFDLNQNINNFDNWCLLFDESINKRIQNTCEKTFVGLSSGYDSGCIVSSLQKHKANFITYSVRADEDLNLLKERHELLDKDKVNLFFMSKNDFNEHKKYILENTEFYESDYVMNNKRYIVQNDKGAIGTSFICSHAKKDGYKIYMSGHGSDEVYSDYGFQGKPIPGFEHCDIAGHYGNDMTKYFPWKNFNGYRMIDFAYKDESVGGSYGIEVRYPFLDRSLVQEFLKIDNKLKNKNYKSPLYHYLINSNYPFLEGTKYKVGFRATANLT